MWSFYERSVEEWIITEKHIYIDSDDQVFTLLVTAQGDNEDKIDELINDFEAEFIAREEIEITNNLNKLSTLALEANIHVVDQGNTYTKELETNKKRKKKQKKIPQLHGNATFFHILERIIVLKAENCFSFRYLWTSY